MPCMPGMGCMPAMPGLGAMPPVTMPGTPVYWPGASVRKLLDKRRQRFSYRLKVNFKIRSPTATQYFTNATEIKPINCVGNK